MSSAKVFWGKRERKRRARCLYKVTCSSFIHSLHIPSFWGFVEVGHSESRQGRLWNNTGVYQSLKHCLTQARQQDCEPCTKALRGIYNAPTWYLVVTWDSFSTINYSCPHLPIVYLPTISHLNAILQTRF